MWQWNSIDVLKPWTALHRSMLESAKYSHEFLFSFFSASAVAPIVNVKWTFWPSVHCTKMKFRKKSQTCFSDGLSFSQPASAFLMFLQIYGEVLHPLHHEEAQCSREAQDDHQQQLPHQQEVTAVEERHSCKNRLTTHNRFHSKILNYFNTQKHIKFSIHHWHFWLRHPSGGLPILTHSLTI